MWPSFKTTTASLSATSLLSPDLICWIRRPTVSSKTSLWQSHPPRHRSSEPGPTACCPAFSPLRSPWRATSNAGYRLEHPRESRERHQSDVTLCRQIGAISEHDAVLVRHPSYFRRDRGTWLVCCGSNVSRPIEVSVAADNLVCGDAVRGSPAEKCPARLTGVRKLDPISRSFCGCWCLWWSRCCCTSRPGSARHPRRPEPH